MCELSFLLQLISVVLTVAVIMLLRDHLLDYDEYEPIH